MSPRPSIVALVAEITSIPGSEDAVGDLLGDYATEVQSEIGNLTFSAWRTVSDPARYLVYEEYRDHNAFRAHLASEHNRAFNAALRPHAVGGTAALTLLSPL